MKEIFYEKPVIEKDPHTETTLQRDGDNTRIPSIRTFGNDIRAEAEKTTKLEIIMAERARKEKEAAELPVGEEHEQHKHLGRMIFLLLLILAFGIGVGAYALIGSSLFLPSHSKTKDVPVPANEPQREQSVLFAIDHLSRAELLANIARLFSETTLAQGEIQIVKLTARDRSGDNIAATTSALLLAMGAENAPAALFRSLESTAIYGMYSSDGLSGFLKLSSRYYPETFAGMLSWEPQMANDLLLALNPNIKKSDLGVLTGRPFKDEEIAGINARVLSDPIGIARIAYAFPDQKTLIIAGNREALEVLITQARTTQ